MSLETTQSYKEIRTFSEKGGLYLAIPVTIKGNPARTVDMGQVLGQISASPNIYEEYDNNASDGTEVASGILARPVVTDGTNDEVSVMYVKGVFKEDQLVGLDSNAKTDLNGRSIPARNMFIF